MLFTENIKHFEHYFQPVNQESLDNINKHINKNFFDLLKNDYYLVYVSPTTESPSLGGLVYIEKINKRLVFFADRYVRGITANIYSCENDDLILLHPNFVRLVNTKPQVVLGLELFDKITKEPYINVNFKSQRKTNSNLHKEIFAILEADLIKNKIKYLVSGIKPSLTVKL